MARVWSNSNVNVELGWMWFFCTVNPSRRGSHAGRWKKGKFKRVHCIVPNFAHVWRSELTSRWQKVERERKYFWTSLTCLPTLIDHNPPQQIKGGLIYVSILWYSLHYLGLLLEQWILLLGTSQRNKKFPEQLSWTWDLDTEDIWFPQNWIYWPCITLLATLSVLIMSVKQKENGLLWKWERSTGPYIQGETDPVTELGHQKKRGKLDRKSPFGGIPVTNPMYGSVSEEPRGQVWLVGGCVRPPGESGGW